VITAAISGFELQKKRINAQILKQALTGNGARGESEQADVAMQSQPPGG
jgi:hypothetical protein